MEKVDFGGKRELREMAEMEGYNVLAPRAELNEWLEKFNKMSEWDEIGIDHRVNVIGNEDAKTILKWLWGEGVASLIQRETAADVSIVQFITGVQCFHKFNVKKGWWDWEVTFGTVADDTLFIQWKKEDKESPPEIYNPDVFMQWSADVNYPFNFAHFSTCEQVCRAFMEHGVRQNVYGLDIQNVFFFARENYPRIGFLIGVSNLEIPGRQVREKHRYVQEKPNLVPEMFTPREKELIAKTEQVSAAEKYGMQEKLDTMIEKLKKGEAPELELKPGIRTWYINEIPRETTIRRTLKWWDRHQMDKTGVLLGFGEFEADEFSALLEELGYTEIDEEKIFAKAPGRSS